MKQVDFYLISNSVQNAKLKLASRLSNKLQRLEQRVLIHCHTSEQAQQLDQIMWSFSDTSFVPHELLTDSPATPDKSSNTLNVSHIATQQHITEQVLQINYSVLINLHQDVPVFNHHFTRIAEIIAPNDADKTQARIRYKEYQQQGFELKMHTVEL